MATVFDHDPEVVAMMRTRVRQDNDERGDVVPFLNEVGRKCEQIELNQRFADAVRDPLSAKYAAELDAARSPPVSASKATRFVHFVKWCGQREIDGQRGISALPATGEAVTKYLDEELESGAPWESIETDFEVISRAHRLAGFVDPCLAPLPRAVLARARAQHEAKQEKLSESDSKGDQTDGEGPRKI
jgi:hypothetical protein